MKPLPAFEYVAMNSLRISPASPEHLDALESLENRSFKGDRLSRRRLQHWIKARNGILLVALNETQALVGYGLVLLHKGTRLARLYSLAIATEARGTGIGEQLLTALEHATMERGRFYMRLEVATNNTAAIRLYERLGYRCFDEYYDYYEDHSDALRMQKRIRTLEEGAAIAHTPWYRQTTDFTCGPAALLMAMSRLQPSRALTQEEELDIWREATTIFMTSGHGGCHPVGLALAAQQRGFHAAVYLNSHKPLFIEGVRSEHKKAIMATVDHQFHQKAEHAGVNRIYEEITQEKIQALLNEGCAVLMLISTYRMDGKKAPHWVCVTALDEVCLYVHDPDPDDKLQQAIDCQHIPIARDSFSKMSSFGSERLRTAVVLYPKVQEAR